MTHTARTRTATGLVILIAALVVMWREGKLSLSTLPVASERVEPQPQDALYRMLDAVRDGNLSAYLDAHAASMAASLQRAADEMGEARFIETLQRQNKPLKGIAINDPERLSPTQARARVEYVYADRNEVQTVFFENTGGKWRITRVDGAERIRTVIPWGTPVNDVK